MVIKIWGERMLIKYLGCFLVGIWEGDFQWVDHREEEVLRHLHLDLDENLDGKINDIYGLYVDNVMGMYQKVLFPTVLILCAPLIVEFD
jgi:hypothetical protein